MSHGQYFVGAFGYADDIILLCPSLKGICDMMRMCEEYATSHSILFNGKKSKYLVFGNYKHCVSLIINNEEVPRSESALNFGHLLHTKDTDNQLIEDAIKGLNKTFMVLWQDLVHVTLPLRTEYFTNIASQPDILRKV